MKKKKSTSVFRTYPTFKDALKGTNLICESRSMMRAVRVAYKTGCYDPVIVHFSTLKHVFQLGEPWN